jgi:hypothetical protein
MGCMIRVTRDDAGSELSNEQLANALRALSGVTDVRVLTEVDVAREALAREGASVSDEEIRRHLMFASNKPADVDAYVARQVERMGHTEVTRG